MKQEILQRALEEVQMRCQTLERQMLDLAGDAQSDAKSTAGDKHETSRAMMHLEQEMLAKQLHEWRQQLALLHQIKIEEPRLITTDRGVFFISISLGKMEVGQQEITCLSPASPL
jgi:hypothetical protein